MNEHRSYSSADDRELMAAVREVTRDMQEQVPWQGVSLWRLVAAHITSQNRSFKSVRNHFLRDLFPDRYWAHVKSMDDLDDEQLATEKRRAELGAENCKRNLATRELETEHAAREEEAMMQEDEIDDATLQAPVLRQVIISSVEGRRSVSPDSLVACASGQGAVPEPEVPPVDATASQPLAGPLRVGNSPLVMRAAPEVGAEVSSGDFVECTCGACVDAMTPRLRCKLMITAARSVSAVEDVVRHASQEVVGSRKRVPLKGPVSQWPGPLRALTELGAPPLFLTHCATIGHMLGMLEEMMVTKGPMPDLHTFRFLWSRRRDSATRSFMSSVAPLVRGGVERALMAWLVDETQMRDDALEAYIARSSGGKAGVPLCARDRDSSIAYDKLRAGMLGLEREISTLPDTRKQGGSAVNGDTAMEEADLEEVAVVRHEDEVEDARVSGDARVMEVIPPDE